MNTQKNEPKKPDMAHFFSLIATNTIGGDKEDRLSSEQILDRIKISLRPIFSEINIDEAPVLSEDSLEEKKGEEEKWEKSVLEVGCGFRTLDNMRMVAVLFVSSNCRDNALDDLKSRDPKLNFYNGDLEL